MNLRRTPLRHGALLLACSMLPGCAGAAASPGAIGRASVIPLPTSLAGPISHDDAVRLFAADRSRPFDIVERPVQSDDWSSVHDITYAGADGRRHQANLVIPSRSRGFGGVMYLHGAGGSSSDFLPEALELARLGIASLLITQPELNRSPADASSAASEIAYEMREMSRALDLLASLPEVDPSRLGFVGFSYGAVRGATFGGYAGARLRIVVLASLPPSYDTPWMAPFDPIAWVPFVSPAALYIQEGTQDTWFTRDEAEALAGAARDPKKLVWYQSGHGLDELSHHDRVDWLSEALGSA